MMRFKGIDMFRGMCIFYMTFGHMIHWYVLRTDFWLYEMFWNFGAPFGGGGFLLVSGLSASLSYRKQFMKTLTSEDYSLSRARNEYLIRAIEIFVISLLWNTFGSLFLGLPGIWLWFVLQTISISLILAWPLLKVSIITRLIICFVFWIANEIVFGFLSPYSNQDHILKIFYFILYNTPNQNPILGYFPFLLLGTVLGDILFKASRINDKNEQFKFVRLQFIKPTIFGAISLITLGILFNYPAFMNKESFSSHMFIVGIELIVLSFLIYLKDIKNFKLKRNYTFFEYYSYYSFTIFLSHHLLFYLFPPQFNALEIWLYIVPIILLWTLLFRFTYLKIGKYASVKFIFNQIAVDLAKKIELLSIGEYKKIRSVNKMSFS